MKIQKLKQKINFYFEDLSTPGGKAVDFFIISLIFLSAGIFVALTYPLPASLIRALESLDFIILSIFVVEYFLRLWVARDKLKHFFSIYSLVDLVAILPFFFFFGGLQFVRVFRVLRILRLIRFLKGREFFFGTVTEEVLIATRIAFTVGCIIFVSAGLFYYVEQANPHIHTFLDALYFSVSTLATVGFGDIVPLSTAGKLITILMIITGIATIPWQLVRAARVFFSPPKIVCEKCGLKNDEDARFCKGCGDKLQRI